MNLAALPKYKQFLAALAMPVVLYGFGIAFSYAFPHDLYKVYPQLDNVMHFLGGASITYGAWLLLDRYHWSGSAFSSLPRWLKLVFIACIVVTVAVLWEWYEYLLHVLALLPIQTYLDTLTDLFFGMAGGIIAATYLLGSRKE